SLEPYRLLGERFAERHPARDPFTHELEGHFGYADQSHAMVDTAGSEPSLGDLETASFAKQDVGRRHPDVDEVDLAVPVGRVIETKDGERSQDLDAGRLAGHQHHRLL